MPANVNWHRVTLGPAVALQQTVGAIFDPVAITPMNREVFEHDLLNVSGAKSPSLTAYSGLYRNPLKLILDTLIATILLLLLLPTFAVITICIVLFGGSGSPIFWHRRIGKDGRPFACLKFRTMRTNADAVLNDRLSRDPEALAEWTATQKLREDPRVYRFGRVLRATSLDELPQLWNVLRGDMALVGPRPVTEDEMQRWYEPHGAAHAYRSVRPGITGLWQVSGRSDTTYNERLMLDCRYVGTLSLRQDVLILCRTFTAVIRGDGAR